ncbi:hypothetical protein D9M72_447780 [compost metagenome]
MQQSRKIGDRSAHAKGKDDDAHMLNRGIGEQAFDVAAAVEHEGGEEQRGEPHRHHQGPGRDRIGACGEQDLETQHGVKRDVQKQPREDGRNRCRPFGVCVREPGMQGGETDLGAIAEQQKHEGDIENPWVEGGGMRDQEGPDHGVVAFADDRLRCHIDEDGAEEREGDADASQNEIFPGGFERLVRAIDADHQHGGERGKLDRDPHQADVVRHEREVHAEHHDLVHGMIETQVRGGQPADLEFMRDIVRAEDAGGEADEGVEDDEDDVEIVDEQI